MCESPQVIVVFMAYMVQPPYFYLRSKYMYLWMPVDEKYDAFDCEVCDAMVSKPYRKCPKCGAEYIGIYTFTDTIIMTDDYEKTHQLP